MNTTHVKLKNGREFDDVIEKYRPKEGYISFYNNGKVFFKDVESMITENDRVSINKITDRDELERAIEDGWLSE